MRIIVHCWLCIFAMLYSSSIVSYVYNVNDVVFYYLMMFIWFNIILRTVKNIIKIFNLKWSDVMRCAIRKTEESWATNALFAYAVFLHYHLEHTPPLHFAKKTKKLLFYLPMCLEFKWVICSVTASFSHTELVCGWCRVQQIYWEKRGASKENSFQPPFLLWFIPPLRPTTATTFSHPCYPLQPSLCCIITQIEVQEGPIGKA